MGAAGTFENFPGYGSPRVGNRHSLVRISARVNIQSDSAACVYGANKDNYLVRNTDFYCVGAFSDLADTGTLGGILRYPWFTHSNAAYAVGVRALSEW